VPRERQAHFRSGATNVLDGIGRGQGPSTRT
jgi:hypothetical protein